MIRFAQPAKLFEDLLREVGDSLWLSIGGLRDLRYMYAQLRSVRRDARDDGTVIDHHNLDEEPTPS